MRSKSGKRDTSDIASGDPLLDLTAPPRVTPTLTPLQQYMDLTAERYLLRELEDHRQWHPDPQRSLVTPVGRPTRQRLRDPMSRLRRFGAQTKAVISVGHRNPLNAAIICARRKARKEVLHALGLKRRGKGGGKRRNWRSNVKC